MAEPTAHTFALDTAATPSRVAEPGADTVRQPWLPRCSVSGLSVKASGKKVPTIQAVPSESIETPVTMSPEEGDGLWAMLHDAPFQCMASVCPWNGCPAWTTPTAHTSSVARADTSARLCPAVPRLGLVTIDQLVPS